MKIEFDAAADAVYIRFKEGDVFDTKEASHGIFIDVDADGEPIGIEIINVSKRFTLQDMTRFTFDIFQTPIAVA